MFYLETQRLILVATPLDVLEKRLTHDGTFAAKVPFTTGPKLVTFPATWPGDALVIFPRLIEQLKANPDAVWDGTLVERRTLTAVGQLGCKGQPDENGRVEIGYGLVPEVWGRGYASEIVGALVAWLLEQPSVRVVTAECLETNYASARVLQKTGFDNVGRRPDEGGTLLSWERKAHLS